MVSPHQSYAGYTSAPHIKKFNASEAGSMPDGIIVLNSEGPYNSDTIKFQQFMFADVPSGCGWDRIITMFDHIWKALRHSTDGSDDEDFPALSIDMVRNSLDAFGIRHVYDPTRPWTEMELQLWLNLIHSYNPFSQNDCLASVYSLLTGGYWKTAMTDIPFGNGTNHILQSVIYDASRYTKKDVLAKRYSSLKLPGRLYYHIGSPLIVFEAAATETSSPEVEKWFKDWKWGRKLFVEIPFDGFLADNIVQIDEMPEKSFTNDRGILNYLEEYILAQAGGALGCNGFLMQVDTITLVEVAGELYRFMKHSSYRKDLVYKYNLVYSTLKAR